MKASFCRPPSPPCEPICSSNGATSPASGSNMLTITRSPHSAMASTRRSPSAAVVPNDARGSIPSSRPSVRSVLPPPPKTTGPRPVTRTMTSPMPGCRTSPSTRPGYAASIVSLIARPGLGHNDEAIRPRRVHAGHLDDPDDLVDSTYRVARLDALGSGVVRDLVVIDEVDVDRGRVSPHLLDDKRGAQMAQQHVRRRARKRIGKGARPRWFGPRRSTRLNELFDYLADRQQRPTHVAVRADEEPVEHVAAADLLRGIVERRRRQEASWCVAGEKIPDRSAALREQAISIRDPPLDLASVFGVVRHHETLRFLVPPAKARNAVAVAVKDARLARRGLRRQERRPAIERHTVRAQPSGEIRHASGIQLLLEDRVGEPVDLDEDDARLFAHVALPVPRRELADKCAEERPVITGREHGSQERVPDRKEHRADDRIDRPVEHHPPRARHEPEREGLHEDRCDRRDGDRDL